MKISKLKSTPYIIPIFIPHLGCPHRCIFCNQESITGNKSDAKMSETVKSIKKSIRDSLNRPIGLIREVQVAFYGGSFTGLPYEDQDSFLGAVQPFIDSRQVQSIRLSTRPDYIDENSGHFLSTRGVKVVELGVQSMEPEVLKKSKRGHTVYQVKNAIKLLKKTSIKIGGQLMVGLPGETVAGAIRGAEQLASLNPDFARVYPALVVRGSGLEKLYHQGRYKPMSINSAVALTARLKKVFDYHDIKVIRMGLQPSKDLTANLIAGPYHAAFGELVKSRLFFNKIRDLLSKPAKDDDRYLTISTSDQSIFRGQKSLSISRLQTLGLLDNVKIVFDEHQPRGTVTYRAEPKPAFYK